MWKLCYTFCHKIIIYLKFIISKATQSLPDKIQAVTVWRTAQGYSPALRVSWSAVNGSGITYTVCYSTTSGTQSDPPSGANCSTSGITGTSTTLGPLSGETTYYIWVAAVSSAGRTCQHRTRKQITCGFEVM